MLATLLFGPYVRTHCGITFLSKRLRTFRIESKQFMRKLTDARTHTDNVDFIPSTADARVNNRS